MHKYDVLQKPMLTEKSTMMRESGQKYSFLVHAHASKKDIAKAVTDVFDVKVESVRTLIGRTKVKRRKTGFTQPRRYKKAFVTLAEGQRIKAFEEQ